MPVRYPPVNASRDFRITRLHSFYYFQFDPSARLEGESHDFWELVYMDAGQAVVQSGEERHVLRQGQLFLHAPNRYHCIHLLPGSTPNIFIVSFSLENDALPLIENLPLDTGRQERLLLSQLLEEGAALYGPVLDCHRDLDRDRLYNARYGALQMMLDYLELLLIQLTRSHQESRPAAAKGGPVTAEEGPDMLVQRLKSYMCEHLRDNLSFSDCCQYLNMSGTVLKTLFRAQNQGGVMHCYQRMRMAEARRMLRSGRWNVTEVATELGYSSCQAFSTQFRRLTGSSPTAYLRRVAAEPETLVQKKCSLAD